MAELSMEKTESSSATGLTTTRFYSSSSADEEVLAEYQKLYFPWKLHRLLDAADEKGIAGIVSWMPDGGSFKVHNKHVFEEEIMSHYFKSSKFKSFQRSLNLWGFQTAPSSAHKQGECYHPFFLKGFPDMCARMQRTRIKGNGRRRGKKKNATAQERKVDTTTTSAAQAPATPAAQNKTFSLEPGTQSDLSLDVYQRQRLSDFLRVASSLGFSPSSSLCAPPRPRAPQRDASALLLQALLIQNQRMKLVNLLTNATRGSQTSSSFY
jgi:hypothetical protein